MEGMDELNVTPMTPDASCILSEIDERWLTEIHCGVSLPIPETDTACQNSALPASSSFSQSFFESSLEERGESAENYLNMLVTESSSRISVVDNTFTVDNNSKADNNFLNDTSSVLNKDFKEEALCGFDMDNNNPFIMSNHEANLLLEKFKADDIGLSLEDYSASTLNDWDLLTENSFICNEFPLQSGITTLESKSTSEISDSLFNELEEIFQFIEKDDQFVDILPSHNQTPTPTCVSNADEKSSTKCSESIIGGKDLELVPYTDLSSTTEVKDSYVTDDFSLNGDNVDYLLGGTYSDSKGHSMKKAYCDNTVFQKENEISEFKVSLTNGLRRNIHNCFQQSGNKSSCPGNESVTNFHDSELYDPYRDPGYGPKSRDNVSDHLNNQDTREPTLKQRTITILSNPLLLNKKEAENDAAIYHYINRPMYRIKLPSFVSSHAKCPQNSQLREVKGKQRKHMHKSDVSDSDKEINFLDDHRLPKVKEKRRNKTPKKNEQSSLPQKKISYISQQKNRRMTKTVNCKKYKKGETQRLLQSSSSSHVVLESTLENVNKNKSNCLPFSLDEEDTSNCDPEKDLGSANSVLLSKTFQSMAPNASPTIGKPSQCSCPCVNIGMKDKRVSLRVRDMWRMNVKDMLHLVGHVPVHKDVNEIAREKAAEKNLVMKRKEQRLHNVFMKNKTFL